MGDGEIAGPPPSDPFWQGVWKEAKPFLQRLVIDLIIFGSLLAAFILSGYVAGAMIAAGRGGEGTGTNLIVVFHQLGLTLSYVYAIVIGSKDMIHESKMRGIRQQIEQEELRERLRRYRSGR